MKKLVLFLLFFAFEINNSNAQEVIKHKHLWNTAIGDIQFNQKWSFNSEVHVRFTNRCQNLQQYLFIPGIVFKVKKEIQLATGFTYFKNYPHGKYPLPMSLSENTLWQQVTLVQKIGKFSLFHRFRMEERFTQKIDFNEENNPFINGRIYNNRFRYRVMLNRPIALNQKLYILAFEEIWLNQSKSLSPISLNQNLLYIGSFYKFNDGLKLGVGYMNQVLSRGNQLMENNSMLSFLCLYKFKIQRKSKG